MPHERPVPYKAVLFDMDGTVLDTLEELTNSLNYIFRRHGLEPLAPKQVRACLGYGYAGLIARALPHRPPDMQEKLADEFKAYYSSHCQGRNRPYDGIMPLLADLRAHGVKTAIVSNKGQAAVSALHREFFSGLVDMSLGESPQLPKKPAPDMIYHALSQLHCSPDEAVYIGDSEVDKETADNAGLPAILVTWGFRDKSLLDSLKPAHIVSSCGELRNLLLPQPAAPMPHK